MEVLGGGVAVGGYGHLDDVLVERQRQAGGRDAAGIIPHHLPLLNAFVISLHLSCQRD